MRFFPVISKKKPPVGGFFCGNPSLLRGKTDYRGPCKDRIGILQRPAHHAPDQRRYSSSPAYQPVTPFFLIQYPREVSRTTLSTSPGATAGR